MSWMVRAGIGAASGLVVLGAVLTVVVCRDAYPSRHQYPALVSGTLTEPEAVDLTRKAIADSGRKGANFMPLSWGTREHSGKRETVLARNTMDPNRGYVRWEHNRADPANMLHVTIEKREGTVRCRVHEVK